MPDPMTDERLELCRHYIFGRLGRPLFDCEQMLHECVLEIDRLRAEVERLKESDAEWEVREIGPTKDLPELKGRHSMANYDHNANAGIEERLVEIRSQAGDFDGIDELFTEIERLQKKIDRLQAENQRLNHIITMQSCPGTERTNTMPDPMTEERERQIRTFTANSHWTASSVSRGMVQDCLDEIDRLRASMVK